MDAFYHDCWSHNNYKFSVCFHQCDKLLLCVFLSFFLVKQHKLNSIFISCLFSGDKELLLYCYAYVGALFVLDLVFLGHTMFLLFQAGSAFRCFSKQVAVTAFNRKHLEA